MKKNCNLFSIVGILLVLLPCCSQKKAELPELNPQSNQIELFWSDLSGEAINLDLQELNALEGSYSGLEMIYSDDNYEFVIRVPAIEKFQVWVGLCTAEGCIIEYQTDSLPLVLKTSDYDSIYDIFNEKQIHPEIVLSELSGDRYFLESFVITINSFGCEDNMVNATGTFSGLISGKNNSFIGSFKIVDYEIDHRFVD